MLRKSIWDTVVARPGSNNSGSDWSCGLRNEEKRVDAREHLQGRKKQDLAVWP